MSTKIITRPELSITKVQIETEQDVLKLFYSGIKSNETKDAYTKTLSEFLFSIKELRVLSKKELFNLSNLQKRIQRRLNRFSRTTQPISNKEAKNQGKVQSTLIPIRSQTSSRESKNS